MKCYVCGKIVPDKYCPEAQLWDWFTGYLGETVHFCPLHKDSPERRELRRLSWQKPQIEAGDAALRARK